jgi:radical SAM protein with 4Fe4S-binding SPASM domain
MLVRRNIKVVAKTVLMQFNVKEYKAIKSLAEDLGAISNIGLGIIPKKDGSSKPKKYELSYVDRIKYLSNGNTEINFLMEDISQKNMLTCKAGKAVGAITPYGDVQPCILMPFVLGNLKEKSFRDIWYDNENKMLNQLRELRSSDLVTCSKCRNISFCIRCPGVAYIETNTLVAPSPTACENAKWRAYQSSNPTMKGGESF